MKTCLPLLALALVLHAPPFAVADDVGGVQDPTPGLRSAGYPQPTLRGELRLSLADAVRMGLENNLDVEVTRFTPYIAHENNRIAWGAFDPELFADYTYRRDQFDNSFLLSGVVFAEEREVAGRGGFRGLVPMLGSQYNLQFDSSSSDTNSRVQAFSPQYQTIFNLRLTQPLLRDLIWNQEWTRVKTSRVLYDISLEQFRRDVMDVVARIQAAYWNLIAQEDQVRVARTSLETAQALLDQTQTQYEVGVVSKVEVVEAEAGVAQREFELIQANNAYGNAQDDLIDLVLGRGLTADSTLQIEPTDRPDDYVQYEIDQEVAVARAFELRPEIEQARKEIDRLGLELKFAKNQRLPRLDGIIAYGNQGLSGQENPNLACSFGASRPECALDPDNPINQPGFRPVPEGGWSRSYDRFLGPEAAEQFTVGAMFSIPIPNRSARSRVSQADLELRRAFSEKRRLEQNIILEVRRAVRALRDAQEGIAAARRQTVAAGEQLRAERIRLEYGESTPFDVLLRQSDFVQAENREIGAFQVYRTAVTALDRAQGTILRNSNVEIDQVRAFR